MADPLPLIAALEHPNVQAFWQTLRYGEGTQGEDGYRVMFGGGHLKGLDGVPGTLDDFADHPRTVITRTMKGKTYRSSAAGAGQFMPPTWDEMAALYGLKDFSPKNQDIAYVGLLIRRKALDDVIAGRFEQAVKKCNREWASLPGSPYGQPVVTLERARQEYEKAGGTFAATTAPAPAAASGEPPNQERDMALPLLPFVTAVLPSIIGAIPELGKLFGSGSAVAERNIKAAEVVVGIAKEAIGARNEQELMETMASDPQAVDAIRAAVKEQWFKIDEVGGGIQAAREANLKIQGDKGIQHNPAVWITIILLAMPFMLLADVFYVHADASYYDENIRTQIVTAVLAVIMVVSGYWLGSSSSSKAKDEALAKR
jgi:muramidase (phage lysozyme)